MAACQAGVHGPETRIAADSATCRFAPERPAFSSRRAEAWGLAGELRASPWMLRYKFLPRVLARGDKKHHQGGPPKGFLGFLLLQQEKRRQENGNYFYAVQVSLS